MWLYVHVVALGQPVKCTASMHTEGQVDAAFIAAVEILML